MYTGQTPRSPGKVLKKTELRFQLLPTTGETVWNLSSAKLNCLQKQTKSSFGRTEQNPDSLKHVIYNIQDTTPNY